MPGSLSTSLLRSAADIEGGILTRFKSTQHWRNVTSEVEWEICMAAVDC